MMNAAEAQEAFDALPSKRDNDYYVAKKRIDDQFSQHLAAQYLTTDLNVYQEARIYEYADAKGHSSGYYGIEQSYMDIADVFNDVADRA